MDCCQGELQPSTCSKSILPRSSCYGVGPGIIMYDMDAFTLTTMISGHFFDFAGYPRGELLNKLQHFRTIFIFLGNPASLYALYIAGLKKAIGVELFFDLMGLLTACQLMYVYSKRDVVHETVKLIREHRDRFPGLPDEEFEKCMSPGWKVVRAYQIGIITPIVFYFILPRVIDMTICAILGIPPWSHTLPLSMAGLVEIREVQQRDLFYISVTLVSIVWCTFSAYSHAGLDMMLVLFGFYYSTIVKGFVRQIKGVDISLNPAKRTELIKNIASHHHSIRKISLNLRDLFGFPYALQNMVGVFALVSLMYSVQAQEDRGLVDNFSTYFNMGSLVGMLTATAYVGQTITDQNAIIFDAMYDFPWYELCPNDRKYFISLLCSSRDPLPIDYFGMFPLNHATLTSIGNTACSYLTFIVSML